MEASVALGGTRRRFRPGVRLSIVDGRVMVCRSNQAIGAIVSMRELALLETIEDRLDVEAARKALEEEDSIPWEQVKAELGLS